MTPLNHFLTLKIPTYSNDHALILKKVLDVDKELKPESCHREISVNDSELIMYILIFLKGRHIHTDSLKLARTISSSLLDSIINVQKTLEEFR